MYITTIADSYVQINYSLLLFAHSRIYALLSLLFSAFITHGYLPNMFMKTAIVPIIKNKTGDTSDKRIICRLRWLQQRQF